MSVNVGLDVSTSNNWKEGIKNKQLHNYHLISYSITKRSSFYLDVHSFRNQLFINSALTITHSLVGFGLHNTNLVLNVTIVSLIYLTNSPTRLHLVKLQITNSEIARFGTYSGRMVWFRFIWYNIIISEQSNVYILNKWFIISESICLKN